MGLSRFGSALRLPSTQQFVQATGSSECCIGLHWRRLLQTLVQGQSQHDQTCSGYALVLYWFCSSQSSFPKMGFNRNVISHGSLDFWVLYRDPRGEPFKVGHWSRPLYFASTHSSSPLSEVSQYA